MRHYTLQPQFAQAYGSGSFGACAYSEGETATGTCTGGTSSGGASGGGLADTGIAIVTIVTIACLLIFVALAVRIWRRKSTPVLQEQQIQQSDTDDLPRQD